MARKHKAFRLSRKDAWLLGIMAELTDLNESEVVRQLIPDDLQVYAAVELWFLDYCRLEDAPTMDLILHATPDALEARMRRDSTHPLRGQIAGRTGESIFKLFIAWAKAKRHNDPNVSLVPVRHEDGAVEFQVEATPEYRWHPSVGSISVDVTTWRRGMQASEVENDREAAPAPDALGITTPAPDAPTVPADEPLTTREADPEN